MVVISCLVLGWIDLILNLIPYVVWNGTRSLMLMFRHTAQAELCPAQRFHRERLTAPARNAQLVWAAEMDGIRTGTHREMGGWPAQLPPVRALCMKPAPSPYVGPSIKAF